MSEQIQVEEEKALMTVADFLAAGYEDVRIEILSDNIRTMKRVPYVMKDQGAFKKTPGKFLYTSEEIQNAVSVLKRLSQSVVNLEKHRLLGNVMILHVRKVSKKDLWMIAEKNMVVVSRKYLAEVIKRYQPQTT